MIGWFRVYFHALTLTVLKPSEDHRMCRIIGKGTFCACGFGNDGVTFDEEMERAIKSFDQKKQDE